MAQGGTPGEAAMTTIRMVDPAAVGGAVKDVFDAVLRRERAVFGATSVTSPRPRSGGSSRAIRTTWRPPGARTWPSWRRAP
jgi:hypothetical protein